MYRVSVESSRREIKRWCGSALAVAFAIVTQAAIVFAAEGHGHAPSIVDTFPYWVNFLIYLSALYLLLRNPVRESWAHRRANIRKVIESAEQEMALLERAIAHAKERLAQSDGEIATLTADIKREAEGESKSISSDSEKAARRIKEQAKDLIQAERKGAEAAVQRELAEKVIQLATERLKSETTNDTDRGRRLSAVTSINQLIQ